jgi:hypothetical protein
MTMTKIEFVEGGLIILGAGLMTWGAILLAVFVVGLIYFIAVGNPNPVVSFYSLDFIRTIFADILKSAAGCTVLANMLQCAAGFFLVAKNRQIAAYANKINRGDVPLKDLSGLPGQP